MGKHSDPAAASGPSAAVLAVGAAVLVAAVLLILWATGVLGGGSGEPAATGGDEQESVEATTTPEAATPSGVPGDDQGDTASAPSSDAADLDARTSGEPVAPPTATEPEPTEDASTTASPSGPPAALVDCSTYLADGDAFVESTEQAAANWQVHYEGSILLADGEATLEEVQADWDRTREAGPDDEQAYTTAHDALGEGNGCSELADTEIPAEYTDQAQACVERAESFADVRTRGEAMMADWTHHLDMMAEKQEYDPEEYIVMWREDVAVAPTRMDPYREAVAALDQAPTCEV